MTINHCERFLSGKPYSLDDEGIVNILNLVKEEKGEAVSLKAKNSLTKKLDVTMSSEEIQIYIVTCSIGNEL